MLVDDPTAEGGKRPETIAEMTARLEGERQKQAADWELRRAQRTAERRAAIAPFVAEYVELMRKHKMEVNEDRDGDGIFVADLDDARRTPEQVGRELIENARWWWS